MKQVAAAGAGQQKAHRVAPRLQMIAQPRPQRRAHLLGADRQRQQRQPLVPGRRPLALIGGVPRRGRPALRQHHHPERLGDSFLTAYHVAHFRGQARAVGAVGEQPVVARAGDQPGLRILLLAEHQPRPGVVDVEAVLHDHGELHPEGVVVERLSAREVDLQRRRFGAGHVADRQGPQPERAHDLRQVRHGRAGVRHRVAHRGQVALRLFAQGRVVPVRHRVEQRGDAAPVVVEAEVGGGDQRAVGVALEQVGEDADQVAGLLRLGGDQHLVFEELHEMRRERPAARELAPQAVVLGGRRLGQAQVLRHVDADERFDLRVRDLHAVLEQPVEEQLLPVLPGGRPLEVDQDRPDALNLLKGVGAAVAHRYHQHQAVRVFLGDLGENLHEVERPGPQRGLPGIGEAVVPGLEFVEHQRGRRARDQLQQQVVAGHVGLAVAAPLPHAAHLRPVRVTVEQQLPQVPVALAVQALADHVHPAAQRQVGQRAVAQAVGPGGEPAVRRVWIGEAVVQQPQQVRLALAALADQHQWPAASGAGGFERRQRVRRRIGDLQEVRRRHLRGAGVVVVRQLDGRPLEEAAPELFAQRQLQHVLVMAGRCRRRAGRPCPARLPASPLCLSRSARVCNRARSSAGSGRHVNTG